jgi:starch phosphorylase
MDFKTSRCLYSINPSYSKRTAYFSMEFAIDQALKIYSGGLGFLAGSHMRSAYNLKQDFVGIGFCGNMATMTKAEMQIKP